MAAQQRRWGRRRSRRSVVGRRRTPAAAVLTALGTSLAVTGALLAGSPAGAAPAGPLAAADGFPDGSGPPVAGLQVVAPTGAQDIGTPAVGQAFVAQSPAQPTGDRRAEWTCEVDPGDGSDVEPYWRGRPSQPEAPCALQHAYAEPGSYTLVLTVTDPSGRSETSTRDLVVGAPAATARDAVQGEAFRLDAAPGASVTSEDGTCTSWPPAQAWASRPARPASAPGPPSWSSTAAR